MKKKKICFLINSMAGGGAEKVVSILLENLPRRNRDFLLIVLEDKFSYKIPSDIEVIKLSSNLDNSFKKFFGIFSGTIKLRKIIKKHKIDVVMSFLERSNYINVLAKALFSTHKAYINERSNPSEYYADKSLRSFFNLFLIKKLYKKSDLIIVNSLGIMDTLIKKFSLKEERIKVIHNPIDTRKIQYLSQIPLDKNYQEMFSSIVIITVGRLIKEKGHKHLIRAFKQVKTRIKEVKLLILGEGEMEENLRGLSKELEIENDVLFLGWQKNPFKFLKRADIFVLSSLTEGLPNALIEAMACGLPVVSSDCLSGPNEILENGKNGILVPVGDEKALAGAVLKLLNNPNLRQEFSTLAEKRSKDFSVKNIIVEYEEFF